MSQITDHTLLPEGRAINDSMPAHVAGMMIRGLNEAVKAQPKGVTVFDQTFVKSLQVRNALWVGLQFLVRVRLRDLV